MSILKWCLVLVLSGSSLSAQEAAPPADGDGQKLSVHGYLSQAFAISDGYQILGIPKDGTLDYRTAALQLRSEISPKDAFVIQLSQDRLGESPVMKIRNEVDLDWIFYERRFAQGISARIGKVKLPFGIYNEVRFVGPLLPFFKATDVFYGEASYSFDSLHGAVISTQLLSGHRFSVNADVYGGEWSFVQSDNATRARAKSGLGAQLWLNTPLQGLRFGLAGHRSTVSNILYKPRGLKETHKKWAASIDGSFSRFRLNAEFEEDYFRDGSFAAGYLLASLHLDDKLSLNAQASSERLKLKAPIHYDGELAREYALGVSYKLRRHITLKLENHWMRGHTFEEPGVSLFAPPLRGKYAIFSVATLF